MTRVYGHSSSLKLNKIIFLNQLGLTCNCEQLTYNNHSFQCNDACLWSLFQIETNKISFFSLIVLTFNCEQFTWNHHSFQCIEACYGLVPV